jgi:hypothetical protein
MVALTDAADVMIRQPGVGIPCASLLLANGGPMKQIQEWLGHSDFSTTANIYTHLGVNSKLTIDPGNSRLVVSK